MFDLSMLAAMVAGFAVCGLVVHVMDRR